MPDVHVTNLLIVVTIGLLAPLVLGFFPRFRLPAIVLEIVLGIVVGPSGLRWVKPDLPIDPGPRRPRLPALPVRP
jgi:NhaP-type Na+/H+ or K+/H+ antiporter